MAGVVRLTAITEIKSTHRGQPSAYLSLTTWLVLDGCKKDRTDPVRQDQSGPPSETPGLNISDTSLYVYFLHLTYILHRILRRAGKADHCITHREHVMTGTNCLSV